MNEIQMKQGQCRKGTSVGGRKDERRSRYSLLKVSSPSTPHYHIKGLAASLFPIRKKNTIFMTKRDCKYRTIILSGYYLSVAHF